MDAFAFMKKKMQEKHLVFKEWDERGGEMVGGSDEFKASLFKPEVSKIKYSIQRLILISGCRERGQNLEVIFFIHYVMKVEETA